MFSLYLEDLELFLQDNHDSGLTLENLTFILMLFADDMVIFGKTPQELQSKLNLLYDYCVKYS